MECYYKYLTSYLWEKKIKTTWSQDIRSELKELDGTFINVCIYSLEVIGFAERGVEYKLQESVL